MKSSSVAYITAVLIIAAELSASVRQMKAYRKCTLPDGHLGSCIQFEKCTLLFSTFLKRPLLYKDIKYLRRQTCSPGNRIAFVCCDDKYKHKFNTSMPGSLPEPGICGSIITNRISSGVVANIDEFPWTALISYDEVGPRCGGSLIHNQYVLTAAHCIKPSNAWKPVSVRLGEWDTSTDIDCQKDTRGFEECTDGHVDIPIDSIIIHPNYAPTATSKLVPHDIALIRLSRSVTYTDFIRPICLPIRDSLRNISFDEIPMDIAGWGITENGIASNLKRKAVVGGMPLSGCQRLYGKRSKVQLYSSQLCVGGQRGHGTCRGDSGGALVALDASNKLLAYYYEAAVISFGPSQCGLHGWPGVYTRVSDHIDWIQQNIRP